MECTSDIKRHDETAVGAKRTRTKTPAVRPSISEDRLKALLNAGIALSKGRR